MMRYLSARSLAQKIFRGALPDRVGLKALIRLPFRKLTYCLKHLEAGFSIYLNLRHEALINEGLYSSEHVCLQGSRGLGIGDQVRQIPSIRGISGVPLPET